MNGAKIKKYRKYPYIYYKHPILSPIFFIFFRSDVIHKFFLLIRT